MVLKIEKGKDIEEGCSQVIPRSFIRTNCVIILFKVY